MCLCCAAKVQLQGIVQHLVLSITIMLVLDLALRHLVRSLRDSRRHGSMCLLSGQAEQNNQEAKTDLSRVISMPPARRPEKWVLTAKACVLSSTSVMHHSYHEILHDRAKWQAKSCPGNPSLLSDGELSQLLCWAAGLEGHCRLTCKERPAVPNSAQLRRPCH